MEPHATNAHWIDGRLEVTTGTQTPFNMRQDLAHIFGLAAEDVRVVVPFMGGAFGAKTFIRTEAITALAARKAERPVRCVLDRDEVFNEVTRHPSTVRIKLGAKRDGTFVAKRIWAYVNTGAYADCGPGVAQKMGYAGVGPYRFDHVAVDSYCVYTNLPPGGAFRGYGAMQSIWAAERVVDMMADKLGIDAVELRRLSRALADAARDLQVHGTIGHGYVSNDGGLDPDTGQGIASSHWHQGSASADLEVDDETGIISLSTLYACSYAGKVINKHGAELQNEGSMTLGLGTALFEELQYTEGQMTNPNLSDYNIASALDVASIRHRVMEVPGGEVHGLGETAVPPVPPAIGNAVASLGYDVRDLPMTPERVLATRLDDTSHSPSTIPAGKEPQ